MTYELPEPIGQIVGKRPIPEGTNEFWGYFAEGYENLNKIDVHTADQMQQAYQAGEDRLRALLTSQSMAYDSGYQAGRDAMPTCLWNNVGECWETTCGHSFEINDGTPAENDMKYCCYCGGKVEEDIK